MTAIMTSQGLNQMMSYGFTTTSFPYIAVGTSTQPVLSTVTALVAELDRIPISSITIVGNTAILGAYFSNAEAVGTIKEVGYFDASSSGNCLIYGTFTAVVKPNSQPLDILIGATLING